MRRKKIVQKLEKNWITYGLMKNGYSEQNCFAMF